MGDTFKETNWTRIATLQLWHWRAEVFHVLLVSIAGLFVSCLLYLWALHPLTSTPGPAWARLTRLWAVKNGLSGQGSQRLLRLYQLHGKPGSNLVILCRQLTLIYSRRTRAERPR